MVLSENKMCLSHIHCDTLKVYFWDSGFKSFIFVESVLTFLLLGLLPVSRVLKICWKLTSRKTIFHQIFRDSNLNSLLTSTEKYLEKIENIYIRLLLIMLRWVTSNMSYYWEPAGHGGHHPAGLSLVWRCQSRLLIGRWCQWPGGHQATGSSLHTSASPGNRWWWPHLWQTDQTLNTL